MKILEILNNNDMQKLEKMGLITINKSNILMEPDILHDSFQSIMYKKWYNGENIFVYVCDFKDQGIGTLDKRYTNATISNGFEALSNKGICNVKRYEGLLTEKSEFVSPLFWDSFKHFNTIIQLPYPYTITETQSVYPDYTYPYGTFPLKLERFKVEGFYEQFRALQEYFFRSLLEKTLDESVKEIKKQAVLKKVCSKNNNSMEY